RRRERSAGLAERLSERSPEHDRKRTIEVETFARRQMVALPCPGDRMRKLLEPADLVAFERQVVRQEVLVASRQGRKP
ncbi:MAG TPA: hypothetical protein VFO03_09965, partial [Gaiellaceae bacterium]|nr:hypothetical protein [Gaiellaceae bacterium]